MHIYDWLEEASNSKEEKKVREFLNFKTLPVRDQYHNKDKLPKFDCFCTYKDEKLKIMGASRMGDVWLSKNFDLTVGYDYRVDIDDCEDFSYTNHSTKDNSWIN